MKVVEAAFLATLILHYASSSLVKSSSLESSHSQDSDETSVQSRKGKQEGEKLELDRTIRRASKSSHNKLPEFSAPIGNITAILGRDVRLVCTVEHLGQYQVAWLKEESKTILSIDTNIITTNYRIFLIPDEEERKWVLHIKDVQGSDRGLYQCQVNTIPVRSSSGYLEVVEPPTIIESQTSQVVETTEFSNVSIQCKADAHPRATIIWRRDDGLPIKLRGGQNRSINSDNNTNITNFETDNISAFALITIKVLNNVKSDILSFSEVDRTMAGIYVCTASNGISTPVSKRIPLYVKFTPKTSVQNKYVSVSLGEQLEIDCLIEAFPKANSYWSRKSISFKQPAATTTGSTNRAWWSSSNHPLSSSAPWLHLKRPNNLPNESNKQEENNDDNQQQQQQQQQMLLLHHLKPAMDQQQHPHNRIKLRHTREIVSVDDNKKQATVKRKEQDEDEDEMRSNNEDYLFSSDRPIIKRHRRDLMQLNEFTRVAFEQNFPANSIENHQSIAQTENSQSKNTITVKQTAINPYTYKLKLVISKTQAEDYGEYSCMASNSMGSSESVVIVTRADKSSFEEPTITTLLHSSPNPDTMKLLSRHHDELASSKPSPHINQQTSQTGIRRSGSHTVYDENYLQAIKTRQNNLAGNLNSRQEKRLNLRQHSNSGSQLAPGFIHLLVVIFSSNIVAIFVYLCCRQH